MSDGMMGGMTGIALSPWLVLLRDLSVKSALLLLAAWALTLAMRRASAAARHLVWLLTFAGLLLLPLLSVTLPARTVAVLPPPAAPAVSSPAALPVAVEAPTIAVPAPPPPTRTLPNRTLPPATPDWPMLLCLLWLLGVALAALPLAAGWLLAVRRLRRCSPITDPATLALAAEAGRRLGLRRPVSLRSGPSVSVPVTFGLVRPVILLPDGAAAWPAERLRVALLHEMAHVRRGDWATQTAARLACALFWHDPLVWPADRMLRAEAERACDDLVLSSGIPALDYAQHLLAVAAALSGANCPLPLAVPMAGRGPLESRLRAVLTARPRRAPSRRLAVVAFLIALVVLVPLAVLRPAARAAHRIAPPLVLTPAILPALPNAVRPSPPPVKAAIVVPPAPASAIFTPIGVPPMKTSLPVKTVALTALAAAMALPAAQAQSPNLPASVPVASASTVPLPPVSAPLPVSVPPSVDAFPISFAVNQVSMRDVLAMMFKQEHLDYIIDQSVSGTVSLHLNGVPFDVAMTTLLKASSQPLEYTVRGGVYHIQPRSEVFINPTGPGEPIHAPNPLVFLDLKKVPIRQALDTLFTDAKANYTVAAGVPGDSDIVTVHLTNVPLVQALDAVLAASETPLLYSIQGDGIFAVTPKRTNGFGFGSPFGTRSAPLFSGGNLSGGVASPFAASAPLFLSPGKPGDGTNPYKALPPVNLSVPRLTGPNPPKGTTDPSVTPPPIDRRPANPMPGKTP